MTEYECFFVVGAPPVRCIRQALFRDNSVKKGSDLDDRKPRRRKLRPETLVAFPGSGGETAPREIRAGTTLESAICEFCFPAGEIIPVNDDCDFRQAMSWSKKSTAM